ncbi:hypothetical protein BMS3Abin16_01463 [archaeon BMS3Abin16]|nr:hypothetical protein BMS3Abin16_01463 [archaeon BMS3Abin16]
MGRYSVLISKKADKFLSSKIDKKIKRKILDEILDLEDFPFLALSHDMAKIKGRDNYYRFRIGSVRIIFRIEKSDRKIFIEKIDLRGSAYK